MSEEPDREDPELQEDLKDYKQTVSTVNKATLTWDKDLIFVGRTQRGYELDFGDVRGQESAKRAMMLAAAAPRAAMGFELGGDIFLNLLKMMVVPLVMASVMTGIIGLGDGDTPDLDPHPGRDPVEPDLVVRIELPSVGVGRFGLVHRANSPR